MIIELKLVVAAVDYVTREPLILIDDATDAIPTLQFACDIKRDIQYLFATYLNCDPGWSKLSLVDFEQGEEDTLTFYYSAIVPADVDLLKGDLKKVSDVTDTQTLALYGKVAQTI